MRLLFALALLATIDTIDFSKASTLRRASNPDRHIAGRVFKVALQNPAEWTEARFKKDSPQQGSEGYFKTIEQVAFIRQGDDTVYAIAYISDGELWTEPGDSVVCVTDSVSNWLRYTDLIMTPRGKHRPARF